MPRRILLEVVVASLVLLGYASADTQPLEKRWALEFKAGMTSQQSNTVVLVDWSGVVTEAGSSGGMGMLGYVYWMREQTAFTVTAGAMVAEVKAKVEGVGTSTHVTTVVPLLVGMRYYLPKSTYGEKFRPYIAAAVGPYIGTETETSVNYQVYVQQRTATAIGGHIGGGVDILLSHRFKLAFNAGYNFMADYSEPIGGRDNYSGAEFGIGFGVMFGGK